MCSSECSHQEKENPLLWPLHSLTARQVFITLLLPVSLQFLYIIHFFLLVLFLTTPSAYIPPPPPYLTVSHFLSHPLWPSGMLGKHTTAPQVPFPEWMSLFFFISYVLYFFPCRHLLFWFYMQLLKQTNTEGAQSVILFQDDPQVSSKMEYKQIL